MRVDRRHAGRRLGKAHKPSAHLLRRPVPPKQGLNLPPELGRLGRMIGCAAVNSPQRRLLSVTSPISTLGLGVAFDLAVDRRSMKSDFASNLLNVNALFKQGLDLIALLPGEVRVTHRVCSFLDSSSRKVHPCASSPF